MRNSGGGVIMKKKQRGKGKGMVIKVKKRDVNYMNEVTNVMVFLGIW